MSGCMVAITKTQRSKSKVHHIVSEIAARVKQSKSQISYRFQIVQVLSERSHN